MTDTLSNRDRTQGAQSIDRALTLLSAFTGQQPYRRIIDLVNASGLGQSTVSRMVSAMTQLGYLTHDVNTGQYALGPEIVSLAAVSLNSNPVHQHARQVAQELAAELGTGVNVAQRQGDRLFYLCNFEGTKQPRSSTLIGRGGPLHATALGKALVHGLPDEEILEVVGSPLERYTNTTITDPSEFLADVARVGDRGYALEHEELALRRACVAAPIKDRTGLVVAAISVSGPLSVMDLPARQEEFGSRLIEQADRISLSLGHSAVQ